MFEVFLVTFKQITILFIFIVIGFMLRKKNKVPGNCSKILSTLQLNVFMPLLVLGNFTKNFKADILIEKLPIFLASLITLALVFFPTLYLTKKFIKTPAKRDVYIYSFTITNIGYFGYPLVHAVFGEEIFFDFLIFCIPLNIFIYTVGMYILNPNRVFSIKTLINMPMIAMIVGIFLGLLNLPYPKIFYEITDMGNNCMAPVAMLLTGCVFANIDLRKMLSDARVYIVVIIKLLIVPISAFAIMSLLNIPDIIAALIGITLSLPAGLNGIVFPEAFGGDSTSGAQLCFISTALCLITVPVIFSIMNIFVQI